MAVNFPADVTTIGAIDGTEKMIAAKAGAAVAVPAQMLLDASAGAASAVLSSYALAIEDCTASATFEVVPNSGATARGPRGLTYSGEASGSGAQLRGTIKRRAYMKDGETYVFVFEASTSTPFTRPLVGSLTAFTADAARAPAGNSTFTPTAGGFTLSVAYTIQAGDLDLMLQASTEYAAGTGTQEWFENAVFKVRATNADKTIAAVLTNRLADFAPSVMLDNRMAECRILVSTENGAQASGHLGVRYPAGSTGKDAVFQATYRVDGAAAAGRRQGLVIAFRRSATFTRTYAASLYVERSDTPGGQPALDPVVRGPFVTADGWVFASFECTLTPTTISLLPTLQQINTAATGVAESLTFVGAYPSFASSIYPGWTTSSEAVAEMVARRRATPRVIFADDFANLQAAMDSITDATAGSPVTILLGEGNYALSAQLFKKAHVNIAGLGKARTFIDLFQANDVSAAQIIGNSVIDFRTAGFIRDLTIRGKNVQYGIHWDTTGQNFDIETLLINVDVFHYGNRDAVHADAWPGQNPVGGGVSAGQLMRAEGCGFYAVNGYAFSVHNNINARRPCRLELEDCVFETEIEGGIALLILSIGSRQADLAFVRRCVFGGRVSHSIQGWYPPEQPDNRTEWAMTFSDCSPFVFVNDDPGATGSRVRPLVTNEEARMRNSTGVRPIKFATWADLVANTTERAIGDEVSVNATDTGSHAEAGRGNVTNAGAYRWTAGAPNYWTKLEAVTDIPAGAVCTYAFSRTGVRLLTSADPVGTPAFVALAPAAIGASARLKKIGLLPLGNVANVVNGSNDILRTDTAAFAFGDGFGIDPAAPGRLKKGALPFVFTAQDAGVVRLAA